MSIWTERTGILNTEIRIIVSTSTAVANRSVVDRGLITSLLMRNAAIRFISSCCGRSLLGEESNPIERWEYLPELFISIE